MIREIKLSTVIFLISCLRRTAPTSASRALPISSPTLSENPPDNLQAPLLYFFFFFIFGLLIIMFLFSFVFPVRTIARARPSSSHSRLILSIKRSESQPSALGRRSLHLFPLQHRGSEPSDPLLLPRVAYPRSRFCRRHPTHSTVCVSNAWASVPASLEPSCAILSRPNWRGFIQSTPRQRGFSSWQLLVYHLHTHYGILQRVPTL